MKQRNLTIFRRFAIVVFSMTAGLGLLFIIITYLSTKYYHEASTQLLNKDVAKHIAEFTSPFRESSINKRKADSVFKNAMVLSPSAEVYFLDTAGKVIAFHAPEKEILQWTVSLPPIENYIQTKGEKYIRGTDPKDPDNQKIFSASIVKGESGTLGYIYVILGSKKSEGIIDMLYGSHIMKLAILAFIIVILLSLMVSFILLKRMRKNFDQMIAVLERFENGDYTARFNLRNQDELEPVTQAFNKMADLLSSTIHKLTKSEEDRKAFIATISHDLRTPLSIARGYTETLMLKREKGDVTLEEQEYYSQQIYNKMLQIENMVNQLFELSKMDDVAFKPRFEPFVLSEIVQESVNTFKMIATEKKVDLKCAQCLYHVWVNADVSMMERVIQNLVENALKNTPAEGFIHASMTVKGEALFFKIENNGPALPEDLLHWINNFKREGGISNQRPAKLGLGLLILQKILLLHNSSLHASTLNGTNTFIFSLPVYNHTA
jgi:signal transduction histidine kinase